MISFRAIEESTRRMSDAVDNPGWSRTRMFNLRGVRHVRHDLLASGDGISGAAIGQIDAPEDDRRDHARPRLVPGYGASIEAFDNPFGDHFANIHIPRYSSRPLPKGRAFAFRCLHQRFGSVSPLTPNWKAGGAFEFAGSAACKREQAPRAAAGDGALAVERRRTFA
jgi:hypothetical protein